MRQALLSKQALPVVFGPCNRCVCARNRRLFRLRSKAQTNAVRAEMGLKVGSYTPYKIETTIAFLDVRRRNFICYAAPQQSCEQEKFIYFSDARENAAQR